MFLRLVEDLWDIHQLVEKKVAKKLMPPKNYTKTRAKGLYSNLHLNHAQALCWAYSKFSTLKTSSLSNNLFLLAMNIFEVMSWQTDQTLLVNSSVRRHRHKFTRVNVESWKALVFWTVVVYVWVPVRYIDSWYTLILKKKYFYKKNWKQVLFSSWQSKGQILNLRKYPTAQSQLWLSNDRLIIQDVREV